MTQQMLVGESDVGDELDPQVVEQAKQLIERKITAFKERELAEMEKSLQTVTKIRWLTNHRKYSLQDACEKIGFCRVSLYRLLAKYRIPISAVIHREERKEGIKGSPTRTRFCPFCGSKNITFQKGKPIVCNDCDRIHRTYYHGKQYS